ncbi:ferric reductase-like transmembrane domain-containing protein [Microbulbifer sp. SSSA007]|uniref:ferric reductase-like transmembrane domain-containing protein n=1 Tax=Microbulbifer sp. SSSA007 TaxID=3243379 RepID=UPI0040399308
MEQDRGEYMKASIAKWSALLIVFIAIGIPLITWWSSVGNPTDYFATLLPPGQKLYVFSKLAGLVAISLLGLQCLLALAKRLSCRAGTLSFWNIRFHKVLGVLTFSLILLHASLFFAAVSVRTEAPAWGLLLPKFTHGYYSQQVSLGLIAFGLLCLNVFAGWKLASGKGKWRIGHTLWVVILPLAFIHALSIGTETRAPLMQGFLLAVSALLLVAGLVRFKSVFTFGIKTAFEQKG